MLVALVACSSNPPPDNIDTIDGCPGPGQPQEYGTNNPNAASCTSDSQCCGFCNTAAICMCYPPGIGCNSAEECCSGTCNTTTGHCEAAANGGMCQSDGDCESGLCVGGTCAS
jgi:hypothetical protein